MVEQQLYRVNPKIWQECAGDSVSIMKPNSKLYYFPRGHLEHACPNYPTTEALSLIESIHPIIPCVISSVDLYADSKTDELVAKLLLTPITDGNVVPPEAAGDDDGDKIVSCAKTLTQSDANNGGAFCVPVECAKTIFPPLDYNTELPSQNLPVTDFHGVVWNFRHVYCGTPKRHLITHGWSGFSNHKKLVGGDTVVFVKDLAGNITVGLRRKKRIAAAANISVKTVTKAAELADKYKTFEVMYYPTIGGFDYVVGNKVVEDAMKIEWTSGMNVKYTVKMNDHTSKGCLVFHGTISTLAPPCICPWRMLQVNWNESTVSENLRKVSPWQVELISNISIAHLWSSPTKKLRVSQNHALLSDMERNLPIPMNCDTYMDETQRDKHNLLSTSSPFNLLKDDSIAELDNVSIEQNITSSLSDDLSSNTNTSSTDCNNKNVTYSFMLFGKRISGVRKDLSDSNINMESKCKDINGIENIDKSAQK